MKDERIVTPNNVISDNGNLLRPSALSEFIGQRQVKKNLEVFIHAAKSIEEAIDHIVFYGPPGLGKTTLASIVAKELQVDFRSTTGPILTKAGDLAAILSNLNNLSDKTAYIVFSPRSY